MYNVIISDYALKELDKIDFQSVEKIFDSLKQLKSNPKPVGSIKLKGENAYRIRKGNYRIIYEVDNKNKEVIIYHITQRKDVYKKK
ncbi:MAG: type II toxin-antitoxin system RelE family toxin [Ignavibacteria bacterium]